MLAGMPDRLRRRVLAVALALASSGAIAAAPATDDPLAAEIDRWRNFLRTNPANDEIWKQIKEGSEATLTRAADALAAGRRWLALQRLAYAREGLLAATYMGERPASQRKDQAAFEQEWRRMGEVLADRLSAPAADALADLRPAAVRALAEAALPQVRVYYDASLDYGRSTMPDSGLYYLGSAAAQRDFLSFARGIGGASAPPAPPLRRLSAELDQLEDDLLAAYRPPASIEQHGQFIAASAMLKEARELDALSLRYGALFRYLLALYRFAPLRAGVPPADPARTPEALAAFAPRLAAPGVDHTLGRLFLELGESEAATAAGVANAAAVARDVLPRYFAALDPAPARPASPAPALAITLVRWPYT
jgi:hypothetical protein